MTPRSGDPPNPHHIFRFQSRDMAPSESFPTSLLLMRRNAQALQGLRDSTGDEDIKNKPTKQLVSCLQLVLRELRSDEEKDSELQKEDQEQMVSSVRFSSFSIAPAVEEPRNPTSGANNLGAAPLSFNSGGTASVDSNFKFGPEVFALRCATTTTTSPSDSNHLVFIAQYHRQ